MHIVDREKRSGWYIVKTPDKKYEVWGRYDESVPFWCVATCTTLTEARKELPIREPRQ